ncbi:MAG: esterase family protein [Gammaproteobacteria bacterium]|nr:esterase family protein [Gammaproteobacteria bacterium]
MNGDRGKEDKNKAAKVSSTVKIQDGLSIQTSDVEVNLINQSDHSKHSNVITNQHSNAEHAKHNSLILLDSIEIPVKLQNNGMIKINVYPIEDNAEKSIPSHVSIEIIYFPEKNLVEEGPLYLSYRDDKGFGNIIEMKPLEKGNWVATRQMLPNESSELGIHRVDPRNLSAPPDFTGPDHFKTQIPLIEGEIVAEVFANPTLSKKEKTGSLQRRIYRRDNVLSDPLGEDENPKLSEGEEIVHIYLPHEYDKSTTARHQYPVIVMLDGDMHIGTDAYGNSLATPNILDNLIAKGKMEPSLVIFSAPTPPTDQGTPRLREYGCNAETALRLAKLPHAVGQAGLSVMDKGAGISGASMGGIQAIYTARMYPEVFDKVIAQSPALWWEPPVTLSGDKYHVKYDHADTWRKDPNEKFHIDFNSLSNEQKMKMEAESYEGFIYDMFATQKDYRTGESVPKGNIEILLQVGRNETGTIHPIVGKEPLTQATKTLAKDFNIPLKILDGPHSPNIWASGLCIALPQIYPCVGMRQRFSY